LNATHCARNSAASASSWALTGCRRKDVHLREHGGFLVHRNQLVGQMPVLQAVVNVELARLEAFPDLTVKPEFVTIGMQACRRAFGIEHQQVRTQAFRQRCRRTFVEWPL
jgi:hypothetical protein